MVANIVYLVFGQHEIGQLANTFDCYDVRENRCALTNEFAYKGQNANALAIGTDILITAYDSQNLLKYDTVNATFTILHIGAEKLATKALVYIPSAKLLLLCSSNSL